jgi:CRISPR/Cas system-associated protein Csx1
MKKKVMLIGVVEQEEIGKLNNIKFNNNFEVQGVIETPYNSNEKFTLLELTILKLIEEELDEIGFSEQYIKGYSEQYIKNATKRICGKIDFSSLLKKEELEGVPF